MPICPQAGAVLGNGEIETRVRVVYRLRIAVDKREVEAMLMLQAARDRELRLGIVDSDHSSTAPRELCAHSRATYQRARPNAVRDVRGRDVSISVQYRVSYEQIARARYSDLVRLA